MTPASDQAWLAGIPEKQAARLARLPKPVYEEVVRQSIENGLDRDELDGYLGRVEAIVCEAAQDFQPVAMGDGPDVTTSRDTRRRRPRGYAEWRPEPATRRLIGQVEEVLAEYADHLPLTIRQIFYRLVAAYDYPKTERAYGRLCEHLVRARRARLIPFDAIRDDGVVTVQHRYYSGEADLWDGVVEQVKGSKFDRQAGQRRRIELWCEASGMLHQLDRVAVPYSIRPYTNGRFQSLSAVWEIVQRALARDVPTVLLHVGDYDPTGESMFEAIADDAAAFVEAERVVRTQRIESVRVALTPAQIATHKLPTRPPKKSDSRSKKWESEGKGGTCQLEALPPDLLAKIVEQAIRDRLDLDKWEAAVEREPGIRAAALRGLPAGGEG